MGSNPILSFINSINMLILIILFPLLGYFSGIIFGIFIGYGTCYITTFFIFNSLILSIYLLIIIIKTGIILKLNMGIWIYSDSLFIEWSFYFDILSVLMLVIVTFISFLVHLYSIEYMAYDPHLIRFMSYLSLFTFFMLILITANNFLQMFVGWEGVGLASYLLINFWYTRIQANKSAIKAMLINRIGDFFILLAIFLIFLFFNTLDYQNIFVNSFYLNVYLIKCLNFEIYIIDLICIFLFFGAMGKSAQLGLHSWLPDAMEGPTPVSALIHAATMVTAGIFLIIRCSFLFEYSLLTLNIIMLIGSSTAFFAATTGLFQNDIKKVIAYSTCSQLGYMIFACGLSGYEVGFFHLSNHAFFKALLFLTAGSIIHALFDEQDMRKMGGLKNILPFSYSTILIGSLALIGFPFFAGFYSKDTILELAYSKFTIISHFCYYLGTISAFATAFYSTRLIFLIFLSNPNGNRYSIINAHEGTFNIFIPLFFLSLLSITIGYISKDLFIGIGSNLWNNCIFILPNNYLLIDIEFLNIFYKILPLLCTLLGSFFAFFIYSSYLNEYLLIKLSPNFKIYYNFFNKKWYFDRIYNQYISQNILNISLNISYKLIDRGLLENFGPRGIILNLKNIKKIKFLHSGNILDYFYIWIFLLIYLFCLIILINFF